MAQSTLRVNPAFTALWLETHWKNKQKTALEAAAQASAAVAAHWNTNFQTAPATPKEPNPRLQNGNTSQPDARGAAHFQHKRWYGNNYKSNDYNKGAEQKQAQSWAPRVAKNALETYNSSVACGST